MGSGSWSTDTYSSRVRDKVDAGIPIFDHDAAMRALPDYMRKVHERLDPKMKNKNGAHAGEITRESLDSDEHPEATSIAVLFDVTGSMKDIPMILQQKLPGLFGLLLRKGYVTDPQILFGAIGDATCDHIPLQIGQFESDNRLDEALESIYLEGGGGGQTTESYELAAYFMARHVFLDSVAKRGKKGYLFIIGDEQFYPTVKPREVQEIIGDKMTQPVSTAEIFDELKQLFEVYVIRPTAASYPRGTPEGDRISNAWRKIFGQNVIELDDIAAVCETIALTIGLAEGKVDMDAGTTDLVEVGASRKTIHSVSRALATVGAKSSAVATASASLPGLDDTGPTARI